MRPYVLNTANKSNCIKEEPIKHKPVKRVDIVSLKSKWKEMPPTSLVLKNRAIGAWKKILNRRDTKEVLRIPC